MACSPSGVDNDEGCTRENAATAEGQAEQAEGDNLFEGGMDGTVPIRPGLRVTCHRHCRREEISGLSHVPRSFEERDMLPV